MAFEFAGIWSPAWEVTFILRFFLAFVSLYFAATLFSIYQQERKIPTLSRVWKTMVQGVKDFPFLWGARIKHAPSRAKHSFHIGKSRIAARVQKSFSGKGKVSKRIHAWAAKHAKLSHVKISKGSQTLDLASALHQFPANTRFTFTPSSLEERYTQGKWHAYEATQARNKIWLVSSRALKKGKLRVKLRHSKRGYYLESA